jgi:Zn-dependent protease
MLELSDVQRIILVAVPLILAIIFHEVAHGYTANWLGDPTARMLGRLSLNPLRHIDPLMTVILPLVTFYLTGIAFGGAKPIPVTPQNFANPRKGMAIVAAAGPLANVLMAVAWLVIYWLGSTLAQSNEGLLPLVYLGSVGVTVNIMLAVFNLIPIPPLDGSRVIAPFLPRAGVRFMDRIEPYGLLIIFALIFLLDRVIL